VKTALFFVGGFCLLAENPKQVVKSVLQRNFCANSAEIPCLKSLWHVMNYKSQ
jgi:hypothetical protein